MSFNRQRNVFYLIFSIFVLQFFKKNSVMNRKLIVIISVVTIVVFFVYLFFLSENNVYKHRELNKKIKQLDENIVKTKNQTNNTFTFEELEYDTAGKLEKYAREQLNLQRANEDVYVVVYE